MRGRLRISSLIAALFALIPQAGYADVTLGGFTFDDNAFPDAAFFVSGGPPSLSFTSTGDIDQDLLIAADPDATTFIFGIPVVFDLVFIDNRIVNDVGPDLVVFELGANDGALVDIEVEGSLVGALPFLLTPTGETAAGFSLNAVAIDLSEFGIAEGTRVQTIRINNDSSLVPGGVTISSSIAAVGALNSAAPSISISIDIKPESDQNPINLRSNGVVPVAILGSDSFDIADIDVSTLSFGPSGAAPAHRSGGHVTDVNGDGILDLLSHYATQQTGISAGDMGACVTGSLLDGTPIRGCDTLQLVPKR